MLSSGSVDEHAQRITAAACLKNPRKSRVARIAIQVAQNTDKALILFEKDWRIKARFFDPPVTLQAGLRAPVPVIPVKK